MNLSCDVLPADLLTVEQAQEHILSSIQAITDTEYVDLTQACGKILAETIQANVNVPPHRNSSMDGYAFAQESLTNSATLQQVSI